MELDSYACQLVDLRVNMYIRESERGAGARAGIQDDHSVLVMTVP